jgi:phosphatidylglycerophosphate synthase
MTVASDENRRPLKSRQWPVFQRLASWLAQRNVSPNAISLSSIAFALAAGAAFALTAWTESDVLRRVLWLAGGVCVQLRLCANLLDGLVAVEGGKGSDVGELYNEAPDRVADTAILLGLGYAEGGEPMLGALASITAVFTAYVRALGASTGVGQVFLGPMAKQQRMALITAVALYCTIAPTSWQKDLIAEWDLVDFALLAIILGGLVTAMRRLARIAQLLRQR